MGMPAKKSDSRTRGPQRHKPRLRLVTSKPKTASRKRACGASASAAQRAFVMFAIVTTVVALLGMGRVWLTVQAAEASHEAGRLRSEIKAARYDGDMLEIRQSALGSPSRIRAIADASMGMAPAEEVTYLELASVTTEMDDAETVLESSVLQRAVASAVDFAAGEAKVLVVGDIGLASTR
jgi:cell division protein FtsL